MSKVQKQRNSSETPSSHSPESSFLARYLTPPDNTGREGVSEILAPGVLDRADQDQYQSEIYQELRRRAAHMMRGQPKNHTLQATALVHEVFLKLPGGPASSEEEKARFLALASRAMRHVLVDHARARGRQKRTAEGERVLLDEVVLDYEERAHDLVALDAALERLALFDEVMAKAVELRFFGGLPVEEVARALGMPKRTFERRWQVVRAWLQAEVS